MNTQQVSPINALAFTWTDLMAARVAAGRVERYAGGPDPGNLATLT